MIPFRDLEKLEAAARAIIEVIERQKIHEESAVEKRKQFRFCENSEKEDKEQE